MKVLFAHGALVSDGQWWWHRLAEPLTQRASPPMRSFFPVVKGHSAGPRTCTPTPLRSQKQ